MADLQDLILLRNDPAVAAAFLQAAIKGEVDAQYGMGLIYAEGRGVEQNEAKSFYWLSRAIEQGDEDALSLQQMVAATMTADQFAEADRLINEYKSSPSPALRRTRRKRRVKASDADLH